MVKRLPRDPKKQRAILDAAVKAFGTNGFRASTDEIAAAAGVSKGSVFRYFDNKKKLYAEAVRHAMDTMVAIVDLSVWTESDDLISMIIRATKYKTELSHRYPNEFALLTRVYARDSMVPQQLRDEVFAVLNGWVDQTMNMVVDSIVERLDLRPELDIEAVRRFLAMAIQAMSVKIQTYFNQHPGLNRIEDMGPIIDENKAYMDMLEHGIVASGK